MDSQEPDSKSASVQVQLWVPYVHRNGGKYEESVSKKTYSYTVVMYRMLYPKVEDEQVASNGERRDSEAGDQEHELNDTRERRNTKCTSREQNERSFA